MKVNRGVDGKEERYPIILTAQEKEIAMKVTLAFKQVDFFSLPILLSARYRKDLH